MNRTDLTNYLDEKLKSLRFRYKVCAEAEYKDNADRELNLTFLCGQIAEAEAIYRELIVKPELDEALRYFACADKYGYSSRLEDLTDKEIIAEYHKCLAYENMEPAN